MFAELLFQSGRPLLAIPPQHPCQWPVRHAVVAWQPTREAARALHDALPLLAQAASVDVLMVDPQPRSGARQLAAAAGSQVARLRAMLSASTRRAAAPPQDVRSAT